MSDLTEATPLSSPSTDDSTGNDMDDLMLNDDGATRGDISPGEMENGEGSGTDFTDTFFYTYTSEFESTFEGSGTSEITEENELFTTTESGITESDVTEETVEGSTIDSTDESSMESVTQETLASGGKFI